MKLFHLARFLWCIYILCFLVLILLWAYGLQECLLSAHGKHTLLHPHWSILLSSMFFYVFMLWTICLTELGVLCSSVTTSVAHSLLWRILNWGRDHYRRFSSKFLNRPNPPSGLRLDDWNENILQDSIRSPANMKRTQQPCVCLQLLAQFTAAVSNLNPSDFF